MIFVVLIDRLKELVLYSLVDGGVRNLGDLYLTFDLAIDALARRPAVSVVLPEWGQIDAILVLPGGSDLGRHWQTHCVVDHCRTPDAFSLENGQVESLGLL